MIDDLINFCLAEIAYEGELGCTIGRLAELVQAFFEQHPLPVSQDDSDSKKMKQNLSSGYMAYIHSLLLRHPSIVLGTVPPDSPSVWIAPPPHKKGQTPTKPMTKLEVIEKKDKNVTELEGELGERLRIAVNREMVFLSLTGSHSRPSKLSDMVYTTLQIIARTREKGMPMRDLGPITGYDPKSIFFQVQQLENLGLVLKISRVPSINWVIHKRFYERSELWQRVHTGETDIPHGPSKAVDPARDDASDNDASQEEEGEWNNAELLADVPRLRLNVLRLLEKSLNQTHQYTNLILAAGYKSPTTKQRRFFTSRVMQMVDEGLIEKLSIPTTKGNSLAMTLLDKGKEYLKQLDSGSVNKSSVATSDAACYSVQDNEYEMSVEVEEAAFTWTEDDRLYRNVPLQRHLIELLDSNPGGITINEMCSALSGFDKRTIEQVLTRLCSRVPPRHLAHLHPVTVMETKGKVRQQRYYTLRHYNTLLNSQKLEDSRFDWINLQDTGEWGWGSGDLVWKDWVEWTKAVDNFSTQATSTSTKPGKGTSGNRRSKKKKEWKNPVIDGVVKKGRPRKEWVAQRAAKDAPGEEGSEKEVEGLIQVPTGKKAQKNKAKESQSFGATQTIQKITSNEVVPVPTIVSSTSTCPKKIKRNAIAVQEGPTSANAEDMEAIRAETKKKGKKRKTVEDGQPDKGRKKRKTSQDAYAVEHIAQETSQQINRNSPLDDQTIFPIDEISQLENFSHNTLNNDPSADVSALASSGVDSSTLAGSNNIASSMQSEREQGSMHMEFDLYDTASAHPLPLHGAPALHPTALPFHSISREKGRPPKQPKPRAINVSALRRNQDLLSLIQEQGGFIQQNFEMAVLLRDHVQKLALQGIQTGQEAGYLPDKKTIQKSIDALEDQGLVKVTKTAISDTSKRSLSHLPLTIVYLAEKSQEELSVYIEGLKKTSYKPAQLGTFGRVMNEKMEFSKISKSGRTPKLKERNEAVEGQADDTLGMMMGPRKVFLDDRQTVAQLFGFLLGRMRRAQELHLYTLNHMLSKDPAPTIVSPQNRIVSSKYWTEDYPLGSFCAIIPAQTYIPYLEAAQQNPEALNQPLKSLDIHLQKLLRIQHASTRNRLLELLRILTVLQLITPLREADNGDIVISDPDDEMQMAFVKIEIPVATNAPLPKYWKFNEKAPLWLMPLAKFTSSNIEVKPPFYKEVSVSKIEDAATYWSILQRLCDRRNIIDIPEATTSSKECTIPPGELASLCNLRSWISTYHLSKLQQEYLKKLIHFPSMSTPLDDPASLMQAAYITCAPQQVVYDYFSTQKERLTGAVERLRRRSKGNDAAAKEEMKRSMAAKAERHLQEVGRKWDDLVAGLVEGELTPEMEERLRPIRSRYITVGGMVDKEKVQAFITSVIRNPVQSAQKRHPRVMDRTSAVLRPSQATHAPYFLPRIDEIFVPQNDSIVSSVAPVTTTAVDGYPPLPPLIHPRPKESVRDIIDKMGPEREQKWALKNRRKPEDDSTQGPSKRKRRFKWSDEYDDLLRDAVAVIKARCRGKPRSMTWLPLEAIFPPVHSNNLRARFQRYIVQPGASNYMGRLEQAWYDLWQEHKGRPELLDEDPARVDGCDLVAHLEFLRKYLDKRKMLTDATLPAVTLDESIPLPTDIKELLDNYEFEPVESTTFYNVMQHYWGETSQFINERIGALVSHPFTEGNGSSNLPRALKHALAQSIIQIIVSTDQEIYSEEQATALLRPLGEEVVKEATNVLCKRGIITKLSKNKAGRTYAMSESNRDELTGSLSQQRCEDAAALETIQKLEPYEWRSWPLDPTEGEMIALLRGVSRHAVEFTLQIPDIKEAAKVAQQTSRRIQDEMLEAQVAVLFCPPDLLTPSSHPIGGLPRNENNNKKLKHRCSVDYKGHGMTSDGEAASCVLQDDTGQLFNCSKCLDAVQMTLVEGLSHKEAGNLKVLLARLIEAGEEGVSAEEIWSSPNSEILVQEVTATTAPLAFWSGYEECRLISSRYLTSYAIRVPMRAGEDAENQKIVFPRRWVDLSGDLVSSTWKAAMRAVVGQLLFRPTINHRHLLQLFSRTYDRLDILDVLSSLEDQGIVRRTCDVTIAQHKVEEMTVEEEQHTFWEVKGQFDWKILL